MPKPSFQHSARTLALWLLCLAVAWAQRPWPKVKSFAYQLQNLNLAQCQQSNFDLLVIDYSLDGTQAGQLGPGQLTRLKRKSSGGRRLVLAYMSIGEAEDYRWYWKKGYRTGKPAWVGQINPDWGGNYRVRYWDKGWQKLLHAYMDSIIAAGFDGVYLDIIDGYEYYEQKGRASARKEMVELVRSLARYGRAKAGADFGVFPQNGEELLTDPDYLACITGIGKEDTYFGYSGAGKRSPIAWTKRVELLLTGAVKSGKLVLNVDYIQGLKQAQEAHRRARQRSFLEYAAPRELDRLMVLKGLQP